MATHMMRDNGPYQCNRIVPAAGVSAFLTFEIDSPRAPVRCQRAGCHRYAEGWRKTVDERTELGQAQAWYIREESGRRFKEERDEQGLTVFAFYPGQQCFNEHMEPMEGYETFWEKDGDWRGNPTGREIEHSSQGWTDRFGEHQERFADDVKRG